MLLLAPFAGVYRDNNIRADATADKLATLKTAFDKTGPVKLRIVAYFLPPKSWSTP